MNSIAFVVIISVGLIGKVLATDFCDPTLCSAGVTQTGCNHPGTFGPACPADAEVIPLTTEMKQALVKRHNQHRHRIASGNLPGFEPALRMATMRWNAELATLAQYNAMTCIFAHDQCRATTQFRWSGQNIATTWIIGAMPENFVDDVLVPLIDLFWSEYVVADMDDINSYPANPDAVIGHFTVITSEKNTAVGCGISKYTDAAMNGWTAIIMACNYARTNIISKPMYRPGPKASQCTTGVNPNYPALCSLDEPYNINLA